MNKISNKPVKYNFSRRTQALTVIACACFLSVATCGKGEHSSHDKEHNHKYKMHDKTDYKHEMSEKSFADVKKYAAMFESKERAAWQKPDQVVELMALKPGANIADIGAGTGYFTRRFARAVGPTGQATGFDLEPNMVVYMQKDAARLKLANYKAVKIDVNATGLPEKHFDVIFLSNTYHHIANPVKYFAGLRKYLKPDGRLIILDFKKIKSPVGPLLKHKITKEDVVKTLQSAGFRPGKENLALLPYHYYLEFSP